MIIVEGPDGAGKTTLVRSLCRQYGLQVGQRATKDRNLLYTVTRQDTYTALASAVDGKSPVHIWDRLFFSEMVYATLVGRDVEFSVHEQSWIRTVLTAMRVPIILCLPPWETVRENAHKDEQMPGVIDNLRSIYDHYGSLWMTGMFPQQTIGYDYTQDETTRIHQHVAAYLTLKKERMW